MLARYKPWTLLFILAARHVALVGILDHRLKKTIPCTHKYVLKGPKEWFPYLELDS